MKGDQKFEAHADEIPVCNVIIIKISATWMDISWSTSLYLGLNIPLCSPWYQWHMLFTLWCGIPSPWHRYPCRTRILTQSFILFHSQQQITTTKSILSAHLLHQWRTSPYHQFIDIQVVWTSQRWNQQSFYHFIFILIHSKRTHKVGSRSFHFHLLLSGQEIINIFE
jgi:hypothetical protein